MLFANRSADAENIPPARRKGQEKLTQDELALNASSDVTAALRRTHDLLQGNLEQSQYAQQTLDESTAALNSLGESYTGLGDMLKNSRGLVGQLLRSQKSDTWYLETAFYILCATIAWLVFRRIIYGPAWWLVWQPLRWAWWFFTTMLAGAGIIGGQKVVGSPPMQPMSPGLNSNGVPTNPPGRPARSMMVGGKGGGWDRPREPPREPERDSMVDQIGKMAQQSQEGVVPGAVEPDDPAGYAPNTKKRMMEAEASTQIRDEL
jgi:protein transport protein SEC20